MSNLVLIAQNKNTKLADKYFNNFEFIDAIKNYQKVVKDGKANTYVYTQLAKANYKIFNTIEAEKWYAKALEKSKNAEIIYNYAEILKINGKYDLYAIWMQKFATLSPKDYRAIAFKSNPDYIFKILNQYKQYELSSLDFNSSESDFGGTIKDGILYFSSGRNMKRKKYSWNEEPFLDIYKVQMTDSIITEAIEIEGEINTKYHEGLVSFSPDGNTMYFSRESFYNGVYEKKEGSNTKISVIQLFTAKKNGEKWSNIKGLPFNGNNYSVKNPSVSADGKTLYFSSNMPGTVGDFDIFKVSIKENGAFGKPVNLGKKINTKEQEMFPFISDDNTLYFSSTGHLGLGGLDIFYIDKEDQSIKNIGTPVNSNSDDFAFSINNKTKEGFVSSNRSDGKGNDDIYAIKQLKPCNVDLSISVIDSKTFTKIIGATVILNDKFGKTLSTQITDKNGKINYTIACNKPVDVYGKIKGYENNSIAFLGSQKNKEYIQVFLTPIQEIIQANKVVLNPILFDFNKANITTHSALELDKLVEVMTNYPKMVIVVEGHTDNSGSIEYNKKLSDRRAKSIVQYVISKGIDSNRISGIGKGESDPKIDCGSKCTEVEKQTNRRSEFIILNGSF
ncbi:OmpA family protein [Polaribacter reichenbachii]|nr:OmpA family protein [Polaribacter reichenbachii]